MAGLYHFHGLEWAGLTVLVDEICKCGRKFCLVNSVGFECFCYLSFNLSTGSMLSLIYLVHYVSCYCSKAYYKVKILN